jgi:hypothetical protein
MNRHFVVWILYGGCSVPGTDDAGLVGSEPERDSGADAGAIAALITASSSLADTAAEAAEEPAKAAPTPRPQPPLKLSPEQVWVYCGCCLDRKGGRTPPLAVAEPDRRERATVDMNAEEWAHTFIMVPAEPHLEVWELVRYGRRVKRPVRPWRKEQPYGPNRQERFSHSRRYGVIRLYLWRVTGATCAPSGPRGRAFSSRLMPDRTQLVPGLTTTGPGTGRFRQTSRRL